MNYIGIDVSKKTFDVAISTGNGYKYHNFSNDHKGFSQLGKLLNKQEHWCVMEASGPYYLNLATHLQKRGISVSVVNPLVIRRFCQMRLTRAKTDKKDAFMIAEYGKTEQPQAWKAEEDYMLELRQMHAYVEQLEKSRTNLIRQAEAFKQNPVLSKDVTSSMRKMIKALETQVAAIEDTMEATIKVHHHKMFNQVQSIPGIGKKTGLMLLVTTGAFTKFSNSKQLSSYFGVSPRIYESGTSVKGKAKICKMGMKRMRSMLYICSWSAIKCNQACKNLYERLVEKGKPKMVALIAVVNKLLKQIFAIVTKNTFYDKNYSLKACI